MEAFAKALGEHDPIVGGLAVVLLGVIVFLYKKMDAREAVCRKESQEMIVQYAKLAAGVEDALNKNAAATTERNEVTRSLAEAMRMSAEAAKAQSQMSDLQSQRIMDRFEVSDRVMVVLADSTRNAVAATAAATEAARAAAAAAGNRGR